MNRLISCIVTTYKRPVNIVKRAVDSIINQTYQELEIIVVNDAPQEEALAEEIGVLLKEYKVAVKYIIHDRNRGACAARNTGISQARGAFLAFLDDDDEWLPKKLEQQMKYMKKTNAALVYCPHYVVMEDGRMRFIKEPLAREGCHEDEFERLLCCNFIGSTSYPLLRRDAVKAVGGFKVGLSASQDHDLWLRIAQQYPIAYCPKPLVKLYYSKEAISRNIRNSIRGYEYLLKKYAWFYKRHRGILNFRLNYLACCCMGVGSVNGFWRYWKRAIKVKPVSRYNFMLIDKVVQRLRTGKYYRIEKDV